MIRPAQFVLITAFIVLLFNSGARFFMGLILHPMSTDLGWDRTTLSSTVTLFLIVSAAALPFTGRLVDRLGAHRVIAGGVVLCGIALALMGIIETPFQALVLYGIVFAIGSAATSITPIGVILTQWYPGRVGMANSIAISGMGVGQLLIISVLASQLLVLGWRGSFVLLGIATIVCVLPLVLVACRGRAPGAGGEDDRCKSDGTVAAAGGDASTLKEAMGNRRLQIILLIYAICGFQDFLIATHIVAFALDEGIGTLLAGNMLAFMGLAGLAGVLVTGVLNDRYGPLLPTVICFLIRMAIFAVIMFNRDPEIIVIVALLYGLTFWVTAPLTVVFARQLCGIALLGTLSGLVTMVHHFAGGIGAYAGGWIFEAFGSYDPAFAALFLMSTLALALTWALHAQTRPQAIYKSGTE